MDASETALYVASMPREVDNDPHQLYDASAAAPPNPVRQPSASLSSSEQSTDEESGSDDDAQPPPHHHHDDRPSYSTATVQDCCRALETALKHQEHLLQQMHTTRVRASKQFQKNIRRVHAAFDAQEQQLKAIRAQWDTEVATFANTVENTSDNQALHSLGGGMHDAIRAIEKHFRSSAQPQPQAPQPPKKKKTVVVAASSASKTKKKSTPPPPPPQPTEPKKKHPHHHHHHQPAASEDEEEEEEAEEEEEEEDDDDDADYVPPSAPTASAKPATVKPQQPVKKSLLRPQPAAATASKKQLVSAAATQQQRAPAAAAVAAVPPLPTDDAVAPRRSQRVSAAAAHTGAAFANAAFGVSDEEEEEEEEEEEPQTPKRRSDEDLLIELGSLLRRIIDELNANENPTHADLDELVNCLPPTPIIDVSVMPTEIMEPNIERRQCEISAYLTGQLARLCNSSTAPMVFQSPSSASESPAAQLLMLVPQPPPA